MVLDVELTTSLLLAGEELVGIPRKKLYRYRRHTENATEHLTKDLTRFREESDFYSRVAQRARERAYLRAARIAERKHIILLNLLFCIMRDARHAQWSELRSKAELLRDLFVAR